MYYKSINWLTLRPTSKRIEPGSPVEYVIQNPTRKPFAPIGKHIHHPSTKRQNVANPTDKSATIHPKIIKEESLIGEEFKLKKKRKIVSGFIRTLPQIVDDWERLNNEHKEWKWRIALPCEVKEEPAPAEIQPDETSQQENEVEQPDEEEEVSASFQDNSDEEHLDECKIPRPFSSEDSIQLSTGQPVPLKFDHVVDSRGRFPDESCSSISERSERKPEVEKTASTEFFEQKQIARQQHQRKFRRLRKAARDLIAWIDSMKPKEDLRFHLTANPDGTKTAHPIHPYIPYPDTAQPHSVVNEEDMVEMVRHAYGARPALTLRVAVHDIDNLPDELEKYDNFYYLKKRIKEDQMFRKPKPKEAPTQPKPTENPRPRPAEKYSFGMNPVLIGRKIQGFGTFYDAVNKRKARYGAWYLQKPLWRKMNVNEELRQKGAHESDEAFERVTGIKRIHAVDSNIQNIGTENKNFCESYGARVFAKALEERKQNPPGWVRNCGTMRKRPKHGGSLHNVVRFGSVVWKDVRDEQKFLPPGPGETSARFSISVSKEEPIKLLKPLDPSFYAFLNSL